MLWLHPMIDLDRYSLRDYAGLAPLDLMKPHEIQRDLRCFAERMDALEEAVRRLLPIADGSEPCVGSAYELALEMAHLLKRWAALDGGAWNVQRHAQEKAELLDETRALIARATPEETSDTRTEDKDNG